MIRSAFVLALLAAACGDNARPCPNDLPAACPAVVPSYQNEIAPIIMERCYPCHFRGGIADNARDFSTYQHVYDQRSRILTQIYACKMPPAEEAQPTAQERAALLAWFVCMAPNN